MLGEGGWCVDKVNCLEKNEQGECSKCKGGIMGLYGYCLNKDFGCVEMYYNPHCLRCDNNFEMEKCTECYEGYELSGSGECSP